MKKQRKPLKTNNLKKNSLASRKTIFFVFAIDNFWKWCYNDSNEREPLVKKQRMVGFMVKYEYKVEIMKGGITGLFDDSAKQTKQLNEAGKEGWKLVCISEGAKYMKYVYIREIAE